MILIDLNGLVLSGLAHDYKDEEVDENLIRHMILNRIKFFKLKFQHEYGEVVICCESKKVWRKEKFPYYKVRRKENRAKNKKIDWELAYRVIDTVIEEMKENLPFRVLKINGCEADDIIGALCEKYGNEQKIMIVSTDEDFLQLQKYKGIKQYSPNKKEFVRTNDPKKELMTKIMKGDSGDDIPNIKNNINFFVMTEEEREGRKRQVSMTTEAVEGVFENGLSELDNVEKKRFMENAKLIDLSLIPVDLKNAIYNEYDDYEFAKPGKLMSYFVKKRLKNLQQDIGDFK